MHELLQNYQTLIVGTLGFAGVITSIILNGWNSRRIIKYERMIRADALQKAIAKELGICTKGLRTNLDTTKKPDPTETGALFVPAHPFYDFTKEKFSDLEIIEPEILEKILELYYRLREFQVSMGLLYERNSSGDYYVVPYKKAEQYFSLLEANTPI